MTQPSIKDYCIKIKGTPLELRKKLIQCLEDNKQVIYPRTKISYEKTIDQPYFSFDGVDWCLSGDTRGLTKITIEEFLELFSIKPKQIDLKVTVMTVEDVVNKRVAIKVSSLDEIIKLVEIFNLVRASDGTYKNWLSSYPGTLAVNITKSLEYCSVNWYETHKHKVITFSEAIKSYSYKIGDKVKIREDLRSHPNSTPKMCSLAGKIVKLTAVKGKDRGGYEFEGFNGFHWSADMFEGSVVEHTSKFKVGDLVELIDNYEVNARYNDVRLLDTMITSIKPGKSKVTSIYYSNNEPVVCISTGYTYGEDCLKLYEPKTEESPTITDFKIGDTICWTKDAEKEFGSSYAAGKLLEKITKITERPGTTPLLDYRSIETSKENHIDAGWVIKATSRIIDEQLEEEPVQKEQEKQTKSTKKEETFMSKLKQTATQTIGQNKEAALIAAKMEAGRVLNKQVIKHVKPHVPMLLRGYLDTPLAPVILANAAAMLGNHTGNQKVQKVAELMLLAAADTTVQSFNLDKIIDDVLAGVKLPTGILDADAE